MINPRNQKDTDMTSSTDASKPLISEIIQSFMALPKLVKFWMMFILGPVNMASLLFLGEPGGALIATLVLTGVALSVAPVFLIRGFSKALAPGHLVPWTLLIGYLLFARPEGSAAYGIYLNILLVVNAVSLGFDYVDSYKWLRGNRAVVRPKV